MTASPDPEPAPERVNSREDLAAFVRALHRNHAEDGDSWENPDLPNFLEALSAWIDGAGGWYRYNGQEVPADGDWRFFARALMAATMYE
ncbi:MULTISPECIES: hypothetical protein [unclassified Streptomyces]|uniref:DUF7660 family protein n=1 Tax=unclassified Streptomyces TaxID=2593676 RepID=UPI000DB959AE|nr:MULTISPECIES: hypothetical protein [unclassified Streptomyces]MYT71371.1 hypothetical protein [Streptomyces sp. SID8367]RAJ82831.1 hypothetical protein K377_03882 [Streptomyces sp. PsTaAH-137]